MSRLDLVLWSFSCSPDASRPTAPQAYLDHIIYLLQTLLWPFHSTDHRVKSDNSARHPPLATVTSFTWTASGAETTSFPLLQNDQKEGWDEALSSLESKVNILEIEGSVPEQSVFVDGYMMKKNLAHKVGYWYNYHQYRQCDIELNLLVFWSLLVLLNITSTNTNMLL